uniref:NADH dehydrogenase subunit 1 n=1 Tax=Polistes rothneyi TaxID=30208 RepID=UPI002029820F|nr:NADH dehydrogenase subunit 1 [Polistes rothneyi]UPT34490.1 NADH dehydrogenase subunit 1 [Polistes rothneyi]
MMILINILFLLLNYLFVLVGILIGVAFLVLLERKFLGYMQDRKGPNKVFFLGIFQPFSDAIKLFIKENIKLIKVNLFFYLISPMIGFIMIMILILGLPMDINIYSMNLFLLYLMSCLSISVYIILMSSWSSNSNYSMLGGMRSLSQSLSYEVSMFLIFFIMFNYVESFQLIEFVKFQKFLSFWFINLIMFLILFISMIAELNRMPFDFIEGESELVSGFNVEYMSVSFTFIFLAEYMMILVTGEYFIMMFFGYSMYFLKNIIYVLIFSSLIIMIRGVLPRLRYDNLMYFCWYYILSISMKIFLFMLIFKIYLFKVY